MKTGHSVLYSNGYTEKDGRHSWQAAVVTATHDDWVTPEGAPPPNPIPQPAEGTVHLTVFEPMNAPFYEASVPRFKEGATGQCWKPIECRWGQSK